MTFGYTQKPKTEEQRARYSAKEKDRRAEWKATVAEGSKHRAWLERWNRDWANRWELRNGRYYPKGER